MAFCLPESATTEKSLGGSPLHPFAEDSADPLLRSWNKDLKACRTTDPIGSLLKNLKQKRSRLTASEKDFNGAIEDRSGLLTTYIACRQLGAMDLLTARKMGSNARVDKHHILPRSFFPSGVERRSADILANIAFTVNDSNKSISDNNPAAYLKRIDPKVLRSQAIPVDSELWVIERAPEFWAERRKLLAQAFNEYLLSRCTSQSAGS